jgi:hypothetical protein
MGIEKQRSSAYFRKRAEEFRTKAGCCEHQGPKVALRKIAEHYDELARRAEQVRTVAELDECEQSKEGRKAQGRN